MAKRYLMCSSGDLLNTDIQPTLCERLDRILLKRRGVLLPQVIQRLVTGRGIQGLLAVMAEHAW